jgi:16S rRNA (adenine(1408)-N(1))-methyltransferase
VEVPSDNSTEKNSEGLSNNTGEGVVIDIGTGDGRFVSAAARKNPRKFFIGIDANVKPLKKPSTKAMRKPAKGGLPNAMFIQAAVEELPNELNAAADEIHIHFPWGSLLKAVACGDTKVIGSLRRIAGVDCLLEIVIGIDPVRDRTEILRLGIPEITRDYVRQVLRKKYLDAGFELVDHRQLDVAEWSQIDTSWAKRLGVNKQRKVTYLIFEAV